LKEKLIIKNFGPIKSVELELGRFSVLIGEQATGKSTIAKLLAICRYFSYIVKNSPYEQPFESGLLSWGLGEAIKEDTKIFYDCEHYSFAVDREISTEYGNGPETGEAIEMYFPIFASKLEPKSSEFKNLLAELQKIRPSIFDELLRPGLVSWGIPTSFFQNEVAKVMDNPFYLPTERGLQSVFSLGKSSIQNIADSLFNQFAQLDQIARQFGLETDIEPLDIIYKNEQGRAFVRKKKENKFLSLNNAASGYQSTIPVVLVTRYYSEIRKKRKTFIIEEPELNLFPAAQQRLVNYLVEKTINYNNSVFATTQSPYILTSLNNLMYAEQVGKIQGAETEKVIEKKYWLKAEDVSAYILLPNGTCENIFDRSEGLIKAEKIDEVSAILNEQFNALLNIEFKGNESDT
jgi:predicted ATP-dependent endonuclease of OLD family